MLLETLPIDVQNEVKNTLKAFDRCNVTIEEGVYKVHTSYMLTSDNRDIQHLGEIHKDDVYSNDEKIVNYVNEFRCYPAEYKGEKDYTKVRDRNLTAKMDNGTIIFI